MSTAIVAALARQDRTLTAECLGPRAGEVIAAPPPAAPAASTPAPSAISSLAQPGGDGTHSKAAVVAALAEAEGNVSAAARALGLQRTQLRRLMERYRLGLKRR